MLCECHVSVSQEDEVPFVSYVLSLRRDMLPVFVLSCVRRDSCLCFVCAECEEHYVPCAGCIVNVRIILYPALLHLECEEDYLPCVFSCAQV
jgi:hypothetical protein